MFKLFLLPSNQTRNVGCYKSYGYNECLYCEKVAQSIKAYLENNYDCHVEIGNRTTRREIEAARASSEGFNAVMAIHTNAAGATAKGCETYVRTAKDSPSIDFALKVLQNMISIGASNRGVKYRDMCEFAGHNLPATLVELDFHTNPERTKWLINNIDVIAKSLAEAVVTVFGVRGNEKPCIICPCCGKRFEVVE